MVLGALDAGSEHCTVPSLNTAPAASKLMSAALQSTVLPGRAALVPVMFTTPPVSVRRVEGDATSEVASSVRVPRVWSAPSTTDVNRIAVLGGATTLAAHAPARSRAVPSPQSRMRPSVVTTAVRCPPATTEWTRSVAERQSVRFTRPGLRGGPPRPSCCLDQCPHVRMVSRAPIRAATWYLPCDTYWMDSPASSTVGVSAATGPSRGPLKSWKE
mmetsp:Transcript_594/g.1412  ORF Transcript_594/g.1412 Transcript_594/m.1412 type:complete len:215 (+) Transcript_594:2591-3235(+)